MRAVLHGRIGGRPAVAVIGVWDPLLSAHRELLAELCAHAAGRGMASLAIALDPDPVRFLWGTPDLPVYTDLATRVQQLLACGLDGVLHVHFAARDIEAGAADLFAVADRHVSLAELWLGSRQSLGRMEAGNFTTIERLATERGVRLNILPFRRLETRAVRECLRAGRVAEAATLVGQPPIQRRPRSGALRLAAWWPGLYRAVPVRHPACAADGEPLTLRLVKEARRLPRLEWPDPGIEYLAFVGGPGDEQ